jgi:hypothetical protein
LAICAALIVAVATLVLATIPLPRISKALPLFLQLSSALASTNHGVPVNFDALVEDSVLRKLGTGLE